VARIWRTPLAGEMAMGFTFRRTMKQGSREWLAAEGPAPDEMVDEVWRHFDHGTQRAILKLYRSAPPAALAAAGERLGEITAPALVLWGAGDTYLPTEFAQALGDRLGGAAEVDVIEGARHWPWLDRPELVDRVAGFLRSKS
jgi:pimeloyl-ACP methyl ester carboxylesterase